MPPTAPMTLVCFALPDEARPFRPWARRRTDLAVLVTGVGARNATTALHRWLAGHPNPTALLTCGFAGGLDPRWPLGAVLCETDARFPWTDRLLRAGAQPASFHQADAILATAAQKAACRQATGRDAVEMESSALRACCAERGIPSATVRVISDVAGEDMPLDFNRFMTPRQTLDFPSLLTFVALHPAKIPALLRFRRETAFAAQRLNEVLRGLWA